MSTNVGTTSGSGRSGRFLGMAAAGLAVVIAAGFVFALNSGNEPTAVPAHPSVAKPFATGVLRMVKRHDPAPRPLAATRRWPTRST